MAEPGFEYAGEFYPWSITTKGKDLQIVDRVADVSIPEFFRILDDPVERERIPIVLALMGTSIRARQPTWGISRIVRLLEEMDLDEIEFVGDEEDEKKEETDPTPPAVAASDDAIETAGDPST